MKKLREFLTSTRSRVYSRYEKQQLRNKPFILVANNCWGYNLYESLGREYNTPFVGLFLHPECYLQLLENFDEYLGSELSFGNTTRYSTRQTHYPVGYLRDIEIHFLHYRSAEEALAKWQRRLARMNQARAEGVNCYFKLCDREGCTYEQLQRFHALPQKMKLSLGIHPFPAPGHICIPWMREENSDELIDGAKQFNRRYGYFDVTSWIKQGTVERTLSARLLSVLVLK